MAKQYARLRNPETREEIVLASRTGEFEYSAAYPEVVEVSATPPKNHDSISITKGRSSKGALHLSTFDSNASAHMKNIM